jgi:phenylalanyl-tRNA synthetase beta chain
MKVPLSWLQDLVEIDMPIEDLAWHLTMGGLEVEEVHYVGLPLPKGKVEGRSAGHLRLETKLTGLSWDRDKFVVGAILEVRPHPAADRLVLCQLDDGSGIHTVLTGGPNLLPYKGKGPLSPPLKVAYAREGAQLYDGHKPGWEVMTLKRTKIRGVETASMACSEKELGISEDHEGVILMDPDAPTGTPLVDYMGDAVLEIAITPNMARNASMLGVAREVAALTGARLHPPSLDVPWSGAPLAGRVHITIQEPELNPRFVLGLIEGVSIVPSPYWVQRRLRLAGMRPINNIVDATNYVMLEIGEPLHAFDYDVLVRRARGEAPHILTRRAQPGERLRTLDGADRGLDDFTVLVADAAGALSIAGVMGGAESEVYDASTYDLDAGSFEQNEGERQHGKTGARRQSTVNVLLEGAAWNFINIRRTVASQNLLSEASYRFSRGVHPDLAERGVRGGLVMMQRLAGGTIAQGLVDAYPLPPDTPEVEVTPSDVERWLGIRLSPQEIADLLQRLEFTIAVEGQTVRAAPPNHRLDVGSGVIGKADVMEEIARIYGYERIPETQIADRLPPQYGNRSLEEEERLRDLLAGMGLQEIITYRLTSPEREARRLGPGSPPDTIPYIRLANPIAGDRAALRHSLLASLLEIVERNARIRERIAFFEIGPVFLASEGSSLPEERLQLVVALTGPRSLPGWQPTDQAPMDFYDLKGLVTSLLSALGIETFRFESADHPSFHPGKCARLWVGERSLGILGELHPLVRERYDLPETPLEAMEIEVQALLAAVPDQRRIRSVPVFPPVLEDLALIVDEGLPAEQVEALIRQAGGSLLTEVRLFDLYRGDQLGRGKKSLAYSLTYQAPDRTLTDEEVATIRERIVRQLAADLGARLRT